MVQRVDGKFSMGGGVETGVDFPTCQECHPKREHCEGRESDIRDIMLMRPHPHQSWIEHEGQRM